MFTSIYLLPQSANPDNSKYKDRWTTIEGLYLQKLIVEKIRTGAGEDFLQHDFDAGKLMFLENMWDLKGIPISSESIIFPDADTFEAIDFSYATFIHIHMVNAVFINCTMDFTRFYKCTFEHCTFLYNHCFASTLEHVHFLRCNFIEYDTFVNCVFSAVTFDNTFVSNNIFFDCKYDTNTTFTEFTIAPHIHSASSHRLDNANLAELYGGISDAYRDGEVWRMARKYKFWKLQKSTRYNSTTRIDKCTWLIFEYLAGYGLRPMRVLGAMALYFLFPFFIYSYKLGFKSALLITCGSLFTFGAKTALLDSMSPAYYILYIFTSFVGISLTALFITVLVNFLMPEK